MELLLCLISRGDGDEVKIELWFEEYAEPIYKYILFMVKNRQTAEDLTQETFIKAFIHSGKFKGHSEVKTWLYRIAYTTTMNFFRKKHPIASLFDSPIRVKSAEELFIEHHDVQELYETIATLKMSYQKVIILRKIQQFSVKETASVLGWSESKVKMQLSRGLQTLKRALHEKGGINHEPFTR